MNVQPSYFAVLPAGVRYDKKINSNAKLLYAEITALCQVEGYCWAPDSYFAGLYDVNARTIRRWIESLISADYLRRVVLTNDRGAIIGRRLYLAEALPDVCQKPVQDPMDKNAHSPIDKNAQGGVDKIAQDNNTRTRYSNKDLTDRQTDIMSDGLTESAWAGACDEEEIEVRSSNVEAYDEYKEILDVALEDVLSDEDPQEQRSMIDCLVYLGAELAVRESVKIHGVCVQSARVLHVFAKAIEEAKDGVFAGTLKEVMASVLSGRVKNQFGYLVSTLWSRLNMSL